MEFVKNFKNLTKNDVALAGGKGASLGEMTHFGIPVPSGFVILSSAFDKFLTDNNLDIQISSILNSVNLKKIHTLENASIKIKSLIISKEIPKNIENDILKYYKKLDTKFVAVRSSATAEDSSFTAWAGQLDSFLNTTDKNILENIKNCWASLFTTRAIFYRFENKLNTQNISVAVVVQKMIESEKSGVAFSINPVTQDKNQIIIEAVLGLGEALVSGQVTPNSYTIEKQTNKIIDKNLQIQALGLYRGKTKGCTWRKISKKQNGKQILSNQQISTLSKIILNIENHFGFSCDIEWAFEKGRFFIVQSRPITTIKKEATKSLSEMALSTMLSIDYERKMTFQKVRLFDYAIQHNMSDLLGVDLGLQVYRIKNGTITHWIEKNKFDKFYEIANNFFINPKSKNKINNLVSYILKSLEELQKFSDNIPDYSKKTNKELLMEYNNFCDIEEKTSFMNQLLFLYFEKAITSAMKIKLSGRNKLIEALSNQVEKIPLDIYREDICYYLQHKLTLAELYQKYLHSGMVDVTDLPKSRKKMQEDIDYIIKKRPENVLNEINKKYKINQINVNKTFSKLKKGTHLYSLANYYYVYSNKKEWKNFIREKSSYKLAKLLTEIGKRVSISLNFIAYLTADEIRDIIKGNKKNNRFINKRRTNSVYLIYKNKTELIDNVKNLKLIDSILTNDISGIRGDVACKGKVVGKVCIILSNSDFKKFKNKDIIVAPTTRPDYVPLLRRSSAIVTNEGGKLSHAAILSRELGKPCIIGTKIATKMLKDGDWIEVDAYKGVVKIIKK